MTQLAVLISSFTTPLFAQGRVVRVSDADTSVILRRGDTLEVSLPSNPSTGYVWRIRDGGTTVLAEPITSYRQDGSLPMLGAPGTAIARFAALGAGERIVYMDLFPPGQPDPTREPARTIRLRVVVR